jgi:hypothetical protein
VPFSGKNLAFQRARASMSDGPLASKFMCEASTAATARWPPPPAVPHAAHGRTHALAALQVPRA